MSSYQVAPSRDVPSRLGRYELLGQLATGGMAEIHLARLAGEGGFEKVVVVKRLLPELVASPAYVAMFLDEGKLVARLDHPNICEVFELGRDGAEYYLAMPYLDGVAVHELIARPRDPDRVAQLRVAAGVIVQACEGLHHAHELRGADGEPAHLVHRDVSPSNLFVTASGTVKVLDFGIAKVRGGAATEAGMIKGKQQYMAPEQLLGDAVDRRCDVFALGIVLYELATHQRLFKRPSDYLAARAILEEPIPRADAADPAIPAALADVIAKALSRAPGDRYATARALGEAVASAIPPAGAAEIAAVVTAGDELTAQRTRQQRVLGEARARTSPASPAVAEPATTPIAREDPITRPMRGDSGGTAIDDAATSIRARPPSRRTALWLLVAALGVAAVVIAMLGIPRLRHDEDRGNGAIATTDTAGSGPATALDAAMPIDASAEVVSGSAIETPSDSGSGSGSGSHSDSGSGSGSGARVPDAGSGDRIVERAHYPSHRPAMREPGMLSVDSTPYATIYIDGKRFGVTPMLKRKLSAGHHTLRAVLADGRRRELPIEIPAGKLARPLQLTW